MISCGVSKRSSDGRRYVWRTVAGAWQIRQHSNKETRSKTGGGPGDELHRFNVGDSLPLPRPPQFHLRNEERIIWTRRGRYCAVNGTGVRALPRWEREAQHGEESGSKRTRALDAGGLGCVRGWRALNELPAVMKAKDGSGQDGQGGRATWSDGGEWRLWVRTGW